MFSHEKPGELLRPPANRDENDSGAKELRRLGERFLWIAAVGLGAILIVKGFDYSSSHSLALGGGSVLGGSILIGVGLVCFYFGRRSES